MRFCALLVFSYKNPKLVYKGKRIDVLNVEEEGRIRDVVVHPGGAVILPLLDDETILLIKNQRVCACQALWEVPAGTLDGEEPLQCAKRELIEETGYQAKSLAPLFHFFTSPGFSNEVLYSFLAKDLTYIGQHLDIGEKIEVVPTKITKALEMIKSKEIIDSKTIAVILYYVTFGS